MHFASEATIFKLIQNLPMKKLFIAIIVILTAGNSFSQFSENVELTLHMKNGDVLTGKSDLREIPFKTDFGVLNFPIDQVNAIDLGLQDSRFDRGNLLNLLDKIEAGRGKEAEKAFDEVVAMDEGAIPFIKSYLKTIENNEPSVNDLTVQTLYEVMLARHKISRNYSLFDVLTYKDEYKVEGSYPFSHLMVDTKYGKLRVERNTIARIEVKIVMDGLASRNSFKLYANKHISGNKDDGWLNTGILVKKGQPIDINAAGAVVLASLSGNTYSPSGGINGSPGQTDAKVNYGQVVFKIGQGDSPKKAGDSYSGIAESTGIIYISIYESVFNIANSGYYSVNVEVKGENKFEPKPAVKPEPKAPIVKATPEVKPEPKTIVKTEPAPAAKPEIKAAPKADEPVIIGGREFKPIPSNKTPEQVVQPAIEPTPKSESKPVPNRTASKKPELEDVDKEAEMEEEILEETLEFEEEIIEEDEVMEEAIEELIEEDAESIEEEEKPGSKSIFKRGSKKSTPDETEEVEDELTEDEEAMEEIEDDEEKSEKKSESKGSSKRGSK
jgi:hypothetical protein